jgi:large subunit ribosomal protein L13Ae
MTSFSSTPIIIDGKGHLLGRLASVISRQILSGQKIIVVHCESLNISVGPISIVHCISFVWLSNE